MWGKVKGEKVSYRLGLRLLGSLCSLAVTFTTASQLFLFSSGEAGSLQGAGSGYLRLLSFPMLVRLW
jgi:hypothetical protein